MGGSRGRPWRPIPGTGSSERSYLADAERVTGGARAATAAIRGPQDPTISRRLLRRGCCRVVTNRALPHGEEGSVTDASRDQSKSTDGNGHRRR